MDDLSQLYTVLAFDPGGTTGYAVVSIFDGVMGPEPFERWLQNWEYNRGEVLMTEAADSDDAMASLEEAKLTYKHEQEDVKRYKILDNVAFWTAGQYTGDRGSQVDQMVELTAAWPVDSPLIVEGFILRTFRMDSVLLEPVRITERYRHTIRDLGPNGTEWRKSGPSLENDRPRAGAGWRDVIQQPPSLALAMVTDDRLRRAGHGFFESTAGKPHARDALRHALTFLRREKEARTYGKTLHLC